MNKTKIFIFISLIFILSACSDNVQNIITDNNLTNNDSVKNNIIKEKQSEKGAIKKVLIGEFKKELSKNDSIIIDLRTTPELKESGIIKGAKQIDFYASDFKEQLNSLDKNKKYLIYCRSGGRSSQTLGLMKQLGFTNVLELQGGMNNWLSSGEKTIQFNSQSPSNEMMNSQSMSNDMMNSKTITLNAKNWEFDQKIIKVKKGEKIKIKVNNLDGLHGIAIPDMRIMGNEEITVDTSKSGEYIFRCYNYCGEGHQDMTGKLIIE